MQRRSQCVSYNPQSGDRRPGSLQVIDYEKVMDRPEQPHRRHCNTSFGKSARARLQAMQKTHANGSVRTNAFMVAHFVPTAAPCGRIVYFPTAAGTIKVSA